MKKLLVMILAGSVTLAIGAGCGDDAGTSDTNQPPLPGQVFGNPGGAPQDPLSQLAPGSTIATVDGTVITAGEVSQEVNRIVAQIARNNNLPPQQYAGLRPMMISQAIENLINQKLLFAAVNASDLVVDEAEVEKEIASIPEDIKQQALASGIDEATIKENVTQALKIRAMLDTEEVTDQEVDEFYRENTENFTKPETISVRHILLAYQGAQNSSATRSKKEAKTEAEEILAKLKGGEIEFAQAATEYSDCPSSKEGGNLGDQVTKGSMVPEFEQAAFALATGTLSEVVETPFGYHLILVEDKTPESTATLEEVSEGLKQSLENRRQMEALTVLMESLREKAAVSYEEGFTPPPPPPAPPQQKVAKITTTALDEGVAEDEVDTEPLDASPQTTEEKAPEK